MQGGGCGLRRDLLAAPLLLSAENWADGSPNLSGMFHICKTKTVITAGLSDCGNQMSKPYEGAMDRPSLAGKGSESPPTPLCFTRKKKDSERCLPKNDTKSCYINLDS